jgi:hypothetical protein
MFCWLCTALFLEAWTLCGPGLHCTGAGRDRREFTPPVHRTQSTAHSHWTINCNLSVTITNSSPWRWPSRVETCRSVLRLMIKLSLCICWWLVFMNLPSPYRLSLQLSSVDVGPLQTTNNILANRISPVLFRCCKQFLSHSYVLSRVLNILHSHDIWCTHSSVVSEYYVFGCVKLKENVLEPYKT